MADAAEVEGLAELVLLPSGSRFGNYVVHECIGQGAMGNIYRAEHALLEKPVALKVMDASLLANPEARARFLREGQAAASIKHPNVVDITDVGVFEGTPYLVMELLAGEDLQVYLERRKVLSEREIASILIPITAALGLAHDRGVVHRDLKPSNIFLSRGPDGEVVPKVLDFGISKLAEAVAGQDFEATPFDQLLGSPLYLPPEAVRGSRDLNAKSDQYSLGVVLYECVTGRPPFAGDSLMSLLNAISAGDYVRPNRLRPDISVAMEHAILRSMNPDPGLRFEHIRELGSELLEVAGMRTQMLWGRTFGRIDLSEPPFSPRSTSPMALMHVPTAPPARGRPGALQKAWLGLAALTALAIPTYWALQTPSLEVEAPAAVVSPLSQRQAAHAAAPSAYAAPSPSVPVPSAGDDPREGDTAADEVGLEQPVALDDRASGDNRAAPPERAKPAKRARPVGAVEPRARAALVADAPGRAAPARDGERRGDELRDMFAPSASRDARPLLPIGSVGANESPILD
jgi:eukaryotic-like serine/threonine-protein kinase